MCIYKFTGATGFRSEKQDNDNNRKQTYVLLKPFHGIKKIPVLIQLAYLITYFSLKIINCLFHLIFYYFVITTLFYSEKCEKEYFDIMFGNCINADVNDVTWVWYWYLFYIGDIQYFFPQLILNLIADIVDNCYDCYCICLPIVLNFLCFTDET